MTKINTDTLYLGIDGGGSSCRARLRDHTGRLLGNGEAGPANLRLGLDQSQAQIVTCTQAALRQAGLENTPWQQLHAGLGLAGAVLDEDIQSAKPIRQLFGHCQLSNDAHIACLGAHRGAAGGIVIIGTGSCAQIVSPEQTRTFGGWGFELSDFASGAWLGRCALSYALQAMEQMRPSSALCEAIAAKFGKQPSQVLRWSNSAKPADYATFAPQIFEYADNGDAVALSLVQRGCEELTLLIQALEQYNTGRIALLGGLANSYQRYLPPELQQSLCAQRGDALDGALLMAGLPAAALERA